MRHVLQHTGEWSSLVTAIEEHGHRTESRNGPVTEVLGAQIILRRPGYVVPRGARAGINHGIAAVEALQLLSGEAFPVLQTRIASKMRDFQDGQVFHGAYGPRLRNQLEYVIRELDNDETSRRAFATLWDPTYDQQDRKDLPCTTSFQFLIRNGELTVVVTMRSNDVVWGTVYDLFQFGFLQRAMAKSLGVPTGDLIVNVGSLHMYDATAPDVVHYCPSDYVLRESPVWDEEPFAEPFSRDPITVWRHLRWQALRTLEIANETDSFRSPLDPTWAWFLNQMRKAR